MPKEKNSKSLKIEIELIETDFLGNDRKTFSEAVQKLILLFNVDMSWQICLESGLLPPIDVLNDYLACGRSDLITYIVQGRQLKCKLEFPNGKIKWQRFCKMMKEIQIKEIKSTLEPWAGAVKWKPFTLTEQEYKCFQEILAVSGFKMKVKSFGKKIINYGKWFSKAIDTYK